MVDHLIRAPRHPCQTPEERRNAQRGGTIDGTKDWTPGAWRETAEAPADRAGGSGARPAALGRSRDGEERSDLDLFRRLRGADRLPRLSRPRRRRGRQEPRRQGDLYLSGPAHDPQSGAEDRRGHCRAGRRHRALRVRRGRGLYRRRGACQGGGDCFRQRGRAAGGLAGARPERHFPLPHGLRRTGCRQAHRPDPDQDGRQGARRGRGPAAGRCHLPRSRRFRDRDLEGRRHPGRLPRTHHGSRSAVGSVVQLSQKEPGYRGRHQRLRRDRRVPERQGRQRSR